MATTFKPFGLKPVYHPSGLDRATPFVGTNSFNTGTTYTAPYSLSAGQAFYQFQPVSITSSGQLTIAAAAAASGTVYGVFDGVEFTDSQGRRSVAKWASKATLDASSEIIFWIFTDPELVYEAQVNGSATTASIGQQYNFSTATGYTTTSGTAICGMACVYACKELTSALRIFSISIFSCSCVTLIPNGSSRIARSVEINPPPSACSIKISISQVKGA